MYPYFWNFENKEVTSPVPVSFFYYLNTDNIEKYLKFHLRKPFTNKEKLGTVSLDKIIPSINKELKNPFVVKCENGSYVILDSNGQNYILVGFGDEIPLKLKNDIQLSRFFDKLSNSNTIDELLLPLTNSLNNFEKNCLTPLRLLNNKHISQDSQNPLEYNREYSLKEDSQDKVFKKKYHFLLDDKDNLD